jgi:hypothetical protein
MRPKRRYRRQRLGIVGGVLADCCFGCPLLALGIRITFNAFRRGQRRKGRNTKASVWAGWPIPRIHAAGVVNRISLGEAAKLQL